MATNLGKKFKALRHKRGYGDMSGRKFAKLAHISHPHLSKIEKGKAKNVRETTWINLASAIGLTLDEFLESPEENPKIHKILWVNSISDIPKINQDDFISIPMVVGAIAAGHAIIPEEYIEEIAIIHVNQIGKGRNLIGIRIENDKGGEFTGRSMEPIIGPGDIVAIDKNDIEIFPNRMYAVKVRKGDIVGSTIKFIERQENILILRPKNELFRIETIDLNEDPEPIIGRVVWAWRSFK